MILLLSVFLTNDRPLNRYSRYDIFKYMLYSYRNLPFCEIYIGVRLDLEFLDKQEELNEFIHQNFSTVGMDKIHIHYDRYEKQSQWIPFIKKLVEKHGENELVWLSQNDDHIFIDFNLDLLKEGIEILKQEKDPRKRSIFLIGQKS